MRNNYYIIVCTTVRKILTNLFNSYKYNFKFTLTN